jgi:hypothetical protein
VTIYQQCYTACALTAQTLLSVTDQYCLRAGLDAQEEALLLLKATLDPTAEDLPSWDVSTPPCTWQGIICNGAGQVTNM